MATTKMAATTGKSAVGTEVVQLNRAEYNRAAKAALGSLGLTYRQLAQQARTGRFTSPGARKLWLAIGKRGSGR